MWPSWASNYPPEFYIFQSICNVVDVSNVLPGLAKPSDVKALNISVAAGADKLLKEHGLDYPVKPGRGCFRDYIAHPRQLDIQYYTTLAKIPDQQGVVLSTYVETHYGKDKRLPFGTAIRFCFDPGLLATCVSNHLIAILSRLFCR